MALVSGIFTSQVDSDGNYDRAVDEEFFARYHAEFLSDGVYANPASNLQVTAAGGLNVSVAAGSCFIQGYYAYDKTSAPLSLSPAGSVDRIDRVVARLDRIERQIEIAVKTGGASVPVLTRNSDVWELALADIRIPARAASITQAAITDQRPNNSLCGFVYNPMQEIDTSGLFDQYYAEFMALYDNIRDKLDGDTAGKLLNQIDVLKAGKQDAVKVRGLLKCTADGVIAAAVEGTDYVGMAKYNDLKNKYDTLQSSAVKVTSSTSAPSASSGKVGDIHVQI